MCDICAARLQGEEPGCQLSGGTDTGDCRPHSPICGRAGIRTQAFNYVFKYSLFPWELVSVDLILLGQGQFYFLFFTWLAWLSKDEVEVLNKIPF